MKGTMEAFGIKGHCETRRLKIPSFEKLIVEVKHEKYNWQIDGSEEKRGIQGFGRVELLNWNRYFLLVKLNRSKKSVQSVQVQTNASRGLLT